MNNYPNNSDLTQAVTYLSEQLDDAHAFMMEIMNYPVAECGEPLVSLEQAVADSGVNVEFSRKGHVLGLPRLYFLRKGLINDFLQAATDMNNRGWAIRVEDGYRNRIMQKLIGFEPVVFDAILQLVIRELGGRTLTPEHMFKRILTLTAQIPKTGTHMSGSAIDISVINQDTGIEVDRGAPYLEMSELTPMNSPFISPATRKNRQEITGIMRRNGFVEYPYEFWHYSSGDAYEGLLSGQSTPALYGAVDCDPDTGQTKPIENSNLPLNNLDEIKAQIAKAILRIKATDNP